MTGGELFDRIVAKEKYTEDEARVVVRKLAGAIEYCHNMGIVHRDLKVRAPSLVWLVFVCICLFYGFTAYAKSAKATAVDYSYSICDLFGLIWFIASKHTLNQLRLQQYTSSIMRVLVLFCCINAHATSASATAVHFYPLTSKRAVSLRTLVVVLAAREPAVLLARRRRGDQDRGLWAGEADPNRRHDGHCLWHARLRGYGACAS